MRKSFLPLPIWGSHRHSQDSFFCAAQLKCLLNFRITAIQFAGQTGVCAQLVSLPHWLGLLHLLAIFFLPLSPWRWQPHWLGLSGSADSSLPLTPWLRHRLLRASDSQAPGSLILTPDHEPRQLRLRWTVMIQIPGADAAAAASAGGLAARRPFCCCLVVHEFQILHCPAPASLHAWEVVMPAGFSPASWAM